MPIHSLYAVPEAFILYSTSYINDEHTCSVSRHLITSFIQLSQSSATFDKSLPIDQPSLLVERLQLFERIVSLVQGVYTKATNASQVYTKGVKECNFRANSILQLPSSIRLADTINMCVWVIRQHYTYCGCIVTESERKPTCGCSKIEDQGTQTWEGYCRRAVCPNPGR
ncbi:hypothetical protein MKX08_008951 [Trichoderma sp. CBMAI-0020]|nr:hypothetical protein MKX08_008951 [Trichoderma sp. CBMAI-0020]